MLPASNRGAGLNFGFPDVCRTPVGPVIVPIPYPNFASNAMAATFSPNILLTMLPALNMGSIIPLSTGDEPGVAHYSVMGPSTFTAGNPKVIMNGLPAINLTCTATSNEVNESVSMQAVPSATNVFLTLRGAGEAHEARESGPSIEALRAVAASLPTSGSSIEHAFLAPQTGYLRIHRFSADVPSRLFTALRSLAAAGARALVIDLRCNPGGELRAALLAASEFVPPGTVLVTAIDAQGDHTAHHSRGEEPCSWPLVLIVDAGTASAAEVLAGSLQALGRGRVVGQRTFGKGSGLAFVRGTEGPLAAAEVRLVLPGGAELHGNGVIPDVELPLSEDPIAHAAQLLQ